MASARKGNVHDAECLYREAIAEGDSYGYNNLAQLLIEDGRLAEGERLFREAGDSLAAKNLALFCSRREGTLMRRVPSRWRAGWVDL